VALPLDTREVQQRTVRMTFQQAGHDASAFNVFVSAQLPDGWLYRDYRIPVSGAEIQNATLRLRHELERIVFYHVREGGGASYPFAALDALTVDEGTARQASVPLADVGQQVWSMLFDGPRTPDELRRVAAGLRDLPHGSSLQVVLDNQQFIVPWALLYDMPGPITAETLDWSGFWGYRYRLDVLTPGQYPEPTIADDPIRLQLLFNDSAELRGFTSAQAEFVRQQLSKAHCAVAWGMEEFEQVLRNPGEATLWYCYCHGTHTGGAVQPHALASESALTFSSGQRLRLADLRRMRPARLSSRPLIFINACEGATQDAFYYDGFMPFFIEERGARGFIGTEVKAPQFLGHDFALEFLRAFARGQEVGEILWRLRRHYLETHHNILAFNYSLYGLGEVRLATPLLAQPRS
jgi:hypothetical protein